MAETPSRPTTTEPTTPVMDNGTISPPTETEEVIDGADDDDEEADSGDDLDPFRDDDPALHHPYPLRLINPLASFHVSTYKPTCSTPSLLHPSITTYWQSDGPQPHTLTAHFFKRVHIVKLRLLLDFRRDESYTPTRMTFWAGTGGHDLCCFGRWEGERPRGWVDVLRSLHDWGGEELGGGGGGVDGGGKEKGIWCHRVEVRVLENHQNGKDTHVRGIQIFSLADEKGVKRGVWGGEEEEGTESGDVSMDEDREGDGGGGGGGGGEVAVGKGKSLLDRQGWGGMDEPDWMRDPVIR